MAGHLLRQPDNRVLACALAKQVRELRAERGWTREQLAEEAGIQSSTLARLENQGATQPGFFTVGKIASALGYHWTTCSGMPKPARDCGPPATRAGTSTRSSPHSWTAESTSWPTFDSRPSVASRASARPGSEPH
ncbi:multiprotein-bridging factor 1 family protein [Streptomyces sp. NPDC088910]|uniref:helix-turn-helix domain-containing protein n=1 Tax=Streptomyces sp. NPDC088910 TaxID=3365911 RepID=UPI0038143DBC